ncbi:hypothetical protein CHS0354_010609 [Potamilus streckersoni]|uniref:Ferric-chelate reductase 1 n=1 Tax=Potamilus streckersoni TaxID=2493646 RepID=A0AAE0VV63_9BIVA|nr:hypothetical protein CHS0354_010609 [Potamilus streckersoni]
MLFQVLGGIMNFPLDSRPWFFLLITFFVHVRVSLQFGSGAPGSKCADMFPIHGNTLAQRDASPYTVKVSTTTYKAGDKISVTISGRGDFRGFLLVAKQNDETPVGSFESTDAGSQVISCTHGGQALTHSSKNLKSSMTTHWTAPNTAVGNIILVATVVADYTEFWVNIKSPVISPTQPRINSTTTTTITTSRPIVTPIVPPVRRKLPFVPVSPMTIPRTTTDKTVEEVAMIQRGRILMDDDCGTVKGCFSDCSNNLCDFLVTWRDVGDHVDFEIHGRGKLDDWIAIGFSSDTKMGDDSVVDCIGNGGVVQIKQSYNTPNYDNRPIQSPTLGLTNTRSEYKDGIIRCSFSRQKRVPGDTQIFDLEQDWYIMYGEGPSRLGFVKDMHAKIPSVSQIKADLQSLQIIGGETKQYPLVKAHGSLMIIAWVMLGGIGILTARYYKNVWSTKSFMKQKIWFQVHRSTMVSCFVLTSIAFIIIFVESGGYSNIPKREGYQYLQAHPVLGIIVTILCVSNPIMTFFRPHPGTKYRPIFNWAHWGVGMSAYILSAICICFGFQLKKSGTPEYAVNIMIGYVVYIIVIDIAMELIDCYGRRKDSENINSMEMTAPGLGANVDIQNGGTARQAEKKETNRLDNLVKQYMFVGHIAVTGAFALVLVLVVSLH